MNIVVAEDDAVTALLITRTLEKAGHQGVSARSGTEAFELLRRTTCDVLITDWMMPEMDGIELIRRVRTEIAAAPAIVMCTSLGDPQARAYALRSGADDFLAKPINAKALVDIVASLGAKRAQQYAQIPLLTASQAAVSVRPTTPQRVSLPSTIAVAIAASSGGPDALRAFFREGLPKANVAYFVVVHGPDWMQHSCVRMLQSEVPSLGFDVAEDGMAIQTGRVYFAPGDRHLLVAGNGLTLKLSDGEQENFVRPAADPLFRSVAQAFRRQCVGVVLTGLGCDGAQGAGEIARSGGRIFVQEPSTAVAQYMPQAALRVVGSGAQALPLSALPGAVGAYVSALGRLPGATTAPADSR